ncbi:MAG: helix-turn-helix transcriptional regulator, partial [Pseudomonadota bacterium]
MAFKADATKIKRWREERHWSQEHLAELAGVALRTIQRVENGEKASQETLLALAAAFNVDAMALSVDAAEEANRNGGACALLLLPLYVLRPVLPL